MKKSISIILSIVMALSLSANAFASSVYSNEFYSCDVKNNQLNGLENDIEDGEFVLTKEFLDSAQIEMADGLLILSKDYQIDKKEYQSITQAPVESHVKKILYMLPNDDNTVDSVYYKLRNSASKSGNGSATETEVDSSISIRGTVTITYETTTINNRKCIKLTGVSGGYTTLDNQVKVKSQSIACGCCGFSNGSYISQNEYFYKTTSSWSHTTPSNWAYVAQDATHDVGANCTYTLQRIGSSYTWSFSVYNNI